MTKPAKSQSVSDKKMLNDLKSQLVDAQERQDRGGGNLAEEIRIDANLQSAQENLAQMERSLRKERSPLS